MWHDIMWCSVVHLKCVARRRLLNTFLRDGGDRRSGRQTCLECVCTYGTTLGTDVWYVMNYVQQCIYIQIHTAII